MLHKQRAYVVVNYRYWLPVICRDKLLSVLVLGHRQGDEALDRDDNAILATLETHAAVTCENIQLLPFA